MSDLEELYQASLLAHSRHPHHRGRLVDPTHQAELLNPLCGDRVSLTLRCEGDRIREIAFEGEGCVLSQASASMLTDAVVGLSRRDAVALGGSFETLLREGPDPPSGSLGPLRAFSQVRHFPTRIRCATLPWRTLYKALERGRQEEP